MGYQAHSRMQGAKKMAVALTGAGILFVTYLLVSAPSGACDDSRQVTNDGVWTCAAPLPTARSEVAAAVSDSKIYVAGGMNRWGRSSAFEVYDVPSNTWQQLPALPNPLHHVGMAAAGGNVYIAGGYSDFTLSHPLRSAWMYRLENHQWSKLADMPGIRAEHAMAVAEDKLYVIGGWGDEPSAIWVYDLHTKTWSTLGTRLPTPRVHLSVVVGNDNIYAIGGRWHGSNVDVVEVLNLTNGTWNRLRPMLAPRSGFAAAFVKGRIHVFGGESLTDSTTMADHNIYDPATDSWMTTKTSAPPRHGVASAVVGNRWFVIGGATRAGLRTPWSATASVNVFEPQ